MTGELFCMHCNPPAPGEHEKSCYLSRKKRRDETQQIVTDYEAILEQVAAVFGMSPATVKKMYSYEEIIAMAKESVQDDGK
ncbi:MAG: hypothetical protein JSV16_09025 [Candidatus Hydrogenedentota bacterium]|nr:MAG: hypothetical protein JSV16_09025 [Candidatus Hydrogenedentota bacterium]